MSYSKNNTKYENLDLSDIASEVISVMLQYDKDDEENKIKLRRQIKSVIKKAVAKLYNSNNIDVKYTNGYYIVTVILEKEERCSGRLNKDLLEDTFMKYVVCRRNPCCMYHARKLYDTAQRCYDILSESTVDYLVSFPVRRKEVKRAPLTEDICFVDVVYKEDLTKDEREG